MAKPYVLASLGSAVALLLAVVGLVAFYDIQDARSSRVIPSRVLLDSRDHSSQATLRIEGRLLGEMGKSIEVKQAECEVKLPFCSEGPCVVFHITSGGLVHDQDDFANVQIPVSMRAGMDLKAARLHLDALDLDLGDLHATCEMTYAYKRFEYLARIEHTMVHEWSLRELANELHQLDPKQSSERILDVARYRFVKKNMSFQRPTVASIQHLSSSVSGDVEIDIAPGRVADAIADFLSRVKVEVLADVRYADSSLHALDGSASVKGQCSHRVYPHGAVKVVLPVTARGRVRVHALLTSLAKASQDPQLMFDDRLNQASHAHSIEFVNEPRSFMGNLLGLSHKIESHGTVVAEGVPVRRLHTIVRERDGRSLQSLVETGKWRVFFSEKLYLGDTNVTVKASIIGGTPMTMKVEVLIISEENRITVDGNLEYNSGSSDWSGAIHFLMQGINRQGLEKVEDIQIKLDGAYTESTKKLIADLNVGVGHSPGQGAQADAKWGKTNITGDIEMTFPDGFISIPGAASIIVQGSSLEEGGQASPFLPKTTITFALVEEANVEKHTITIAMDQFESESEAYKSLVPSGGEQLNGETQYSYDLRQSAFGNSLKFLSDMSADIAVNIDKSSSAEWSVTGNVQMQTSCQVKDDAQLQAYLPNMMTANEHAAFKANKNHRKYKCESDETSCTKDATTYQCCKSDSGSYEGAFEDETACDAMQLKLMEMMGLTMGDDITESFETKMAPNPFTLEKEGKYDKLVVDIKEDGTSTAIVTFKYYQLNDMTVDAVIKDVVTVNVAVTNDWETATGDLYSQGVTVMAKDTATPPTQIFSLTVMQNNTKGFMTIAEAGPVHLHQNGKMQLYVLAVGETDPILRVDGSMDVAETAAENSMTGAIAIYVESEKQAEGTLSCKGGAAAPYVLAVELKDKEQAIIASAASTMSKIDTNYVGDVTLKGGDTEGVVQTTMSAGFLTHAGGMDKFSMAVSLGAGGNGYEDFGADFAWFITRGTAPVRDMSGMGMSFGGYEFFGVKQVAANRARDPKLAVSLDIGMPYNVQVNDADRGIAKVTSFIGQFKLERPEEFDAAKYLKSVAAVSGVDMSKVRAKKIKYVCKVAYSLPAAVTEAQAKTTVATTAGVSEDRVTVELSRRLESDAAGFRDRRLQASTTVKATIETETADELNTVSTKTADTAAVKTNLETATGTTVASVTVSEAPKKLVEVETEIEGEGGLPAVEVPSADALGTQLSQELGQEVTTESLVQNPTTDKSVNNGFIAGAAIPSSLSPLSSIVLGVACLFVYQG